MIYPVVELAENQFGTGAVHNKIDIRDHKWHRVAKAMDSSPFDWSVGYDVEVELQNFLKNPSFKISIKDQNGSGSCVGQALAYYEATQDAFEKGVYTEKSARDAYSQIFLPGGGSSTRSAAALITKKGICREALMPSYKDNLPPPEWFMEIRPDASQTTIADALKAKGTAYAKVRNNIDEMAQAIRDNHGIMFVVEGKDNGTWRGAFPQPPQDGNYYWAHCLYAGRAKMINGSKFIGVCNSWGINTGDHGWQWISEDYINRHSRDGIVIYDTPEDVTAQVNTWYQMIIELLQKILFGTNTKLVH